MKLKITSLIVVAVSLNLIGEAKPGESYTLTGKEKGIAEIVQGDVKQYPDFYRGENINSYISKFKRENKIGKRELSPGDQLLFPETLASIKKKNESSEPEGKYIEGKSSHLFGVIFQLKIDLQGNLTTFEINKVIDPKSGTTDAVNIEIPAVYFESAKTHAGQNGYKPHLDNGQPVDFYIYYYYDPENPEVVITEIKK